MERLPSARGPISPKPLYQPTIVPSASSFAARYMVAAAGAATAQSDCAHGKAGMESAARAVLAEAIRGPQAQCFVGRVGRDDELGERLPEH